ncbi:MAG: hypothetical protein IT379_19980 [Deltaproteobacteria bacterium]|nr:hypothetical protein [Deltaproteobacteria bacterium]
MAPTHRRIRPSRTTTPSTPAAAKAARRAGVERKADVALVERTLGLLGRHQRAEAKGRRAIGEHLLDAYFDGDAALAKSKSPSKPKSYALLAQRAQPESDWQERDLRDAVAMAIAYRSLPARVRGAVSPTYLLRLASIDDVAQRRALAARIAAGELSGGAEVLDAIARAGAGERGGGRARTPSTLRSVSTLVRAAERAEDGGALTIRTLRALDDDARTRVAHSLRKLAARLNELAERAEKA